MNSYSTYDFVKESNRIEGIYRDPTKEEIDEHDRFVVLSKITVEELKQFVSVYQPNAVLRDRFGLNVKVGGYYPPSGGPNIVMAVERLLGYTNDGIWTPWAIHMKYEDIHPFTDGNGRSGRVLWAWCMKRNGMSTKLGFLHTFYYQTLQHSRI